MKNKNKLSDKNNSENNQMNNNICNISNDSDDLYDEKNLKIVKTLNTVSQKKRIKKIKKNIYKKDLKLNDKPRYTKGEEIFNAVSHIVGGVFGIIALIISVVYASLYGDVYSIVSAVIYGLSMIVLYTFSALYHFLPSGTVAKKVFQIIDHCSIFFLISGTYTPFCLVSLRNVGAWGWTIFGIVWGLTIIGVTLNAIMMKKVKKLSLLLYLLMGWCVIVALVPLLKTINIIGFWLLLAGGIVYSIGAIFYVCGKKAKYIHSVWHLFVLGGSILQFLSIILYVI